jgi:hypothetical protein
MTRLQHEVLVGFEEDLAILGKFLPGQFVVLLQLPLPLFPVLGNHGLGA